jgi:hypothetical protein
MTPGAFCDEDNTCFGRRNNIEMTRVLELRVGRGVTERWAAVGAHRYAADPAVRGTRPERGSQSSVGGRFPGLTYDRGRHGWVGRA